MSDRCFQGVALLSLNRQGAPRGTPQQMTRLRFVWRPPYDRDVQKSSLWRPIRAKSCVAGAIHGSNSGRQTGVRRESWRAGEIGTRAERDARRNTAQREEHAGDLEGETAAAVDLRALTREEGEAEEREEGEAEGRREEQSSASGGEGSRAGHPERGGGKQSSHSCGRAVVWRRNSSGERRR